MVQASEVPACGHANLPGQEGRGPARGVCGLQRGAPRMVHWLSDRPCPGLHPGSEAGSEMHNACLSVILKDCSAWITAPLSRSTAGAD